MAGGWRDAYDEGRRSTPLERELQGRSGGGGRQGPPDDKDRDGCGPLVLLILACLLTLVLVVL
jgi:hypothetical protein